MICNRLTDDALGGVDDVKGKVADLEDKLNQFSNYVEDRLRKGGNTSFQSI